LSLIALPLPPIDALQLATAADAQQRALWHSSLSDPPSDRIEADATAAKAVMAECLLWWTPRAPALVPDTNSGTFQLQVTKSHDAEEADADANG